MSGITRQITNASADKPGSLGSVLRTHMVPGKKANPKSRPPEEAHVHIHTEI